MKKELKCRICLSSNLEAVIDLGRQPWANNFLRKEEIGKEHYYPLKVLYCRDCKAAQLGYTVKKEIMFGNHTYLSGITRTLNDHFKKIAEEVDSRFFKKVKNKSVLDIGSNDGTQLKYYKTLGYDVLGIESSRKIAEIANNRGIKTINDFFNLDVARSLGKKFDVINAAGVFFHLEEIHSVTKAIAELLKDDGVFVVQFLYMKKIMENMAFDQIYHEHLLYYNLKTIETLLNKYNLSIFDAYISSIHGGSIIGFASHKDRRKKSRRLRTLIKAEENHNSNDISVYKNFAKNIGKMKKKNIDFLKIVKKQGKTVYGFGAPVKGNTLLNHFCIGTKYLDCLVEKNELRRGLYSPGMHIPIVMENEIEKLPDIYYVLAWNFKKEILENNKNLIKKGIKFYFPVNPRVDR